MVTTLKKFDLPKQPAADARFTRRTPSQKRFENQKPLLRYKRARIYSAQLGRFIGRDPLGFVDGYSLYRAYFVPDSVDPLGLQQRYAPGFGAPYTHGDGPDKTRPLTPGEIRICNRVFGGKLDASKVRIGMCGLTPLHEKTTVNPIGTPWFPESNYTSDFSNADLGLRRHFVHEITHTLQTQEGNCNVTEAVFLCVAHGNYGEAYAYPEDWLGSPLWCFNMEQQAEVFSDYYRHLCNQNPDGILMAKFRITTNCSTQRPRTGIGAEATIAKRNLELPQLKIFAVVVASHNFLAVASTFIVAWRIAGKN